MAKIAPFGRYRAMDSNGAPLSGGLLYTYEAGTSTPKATYTDNSGGVTNTNPVVMDANGYADVWLGTGGYKFVLKSSAGVTQWTQDNIDGGSTTGFASSVVSVSSSFGLGVTYQGAVVVCTAALTVSLIPAATAGNGFAVVLVNSGSGSVTIDPDGSETVNGSATYIIQPGCFATLHCDGIKWFANGNAEEFPSNTFRVDDSADGTKKLAFDVSGLTTATTRTLTVQDLSGTVYITGGSDVSIADGGTGASTALGARTNLGITASKSVSGLVITNNSATPNTKIDISATEATIPNASGLYVRHTGVSVTINAGVVGANGIDSGALANSTWYYVYIISDGTTAAGLISTSYTSPTLPSGYTYYARVGAFITDGSAAFKRIRQVGRRAQYVVTASTNTAAMPQMGTGVVGSTSTPTWVSVSVASYVPSSVASSIVGVISNNASGNNTIVAPNSGYGPQGSTTNPPPVCINTPTGNGLAAAQFLFTLESSNIYWASSNGSIACLGWEDNI